MQELLRERFGNDVASLIMSDVIDLSREDWRHAHNQYFYRCVGDILRYGRYADELTQRNAQLTAAGFHSRERVTPLMVSIMNKRRAFV